MDIRIYETPISYYGRTYEEGKKVGLSDGLMAIFYIFYFNLIYPHKKHVQKHIMRVSQTFEGQRVEC